SRTRAALKAPALGTEPRDRRTPYPRRHDRRLILLLLLRSAGEWRRRTVRGWSALPAQRSGCIAAIRRTLSPRYRSRASMPDRAKGMWVVSDSIHSRRGPTSFARISRTILRSRRVYRIAWSCGDQASNLASFFLMSHEEDRTFAFGRGACCAIARTSPSRSAVRSTFIWSRGTNT